jgi:hypothetical protein
MILLSYLPAQTIKLDLVSLLYLMGQIKYKCSKCGEIKWETDFYKTSTAYCKPCRKQSNKDYRQKLGKEFAAIVKRSRDKYYNPLKAEILEAYGNSCSCCGEDIKEFLTIDHIHNDGAEERSHSNWSQLTFYRRLKKTNFPKDRYRLLCMNCNWARGVFGYCPHQKEIELLP